MKLTGHQDYDLNQALNFRFERLASLPVWIATDEGRAIFVETPGVDYGLHVGNNSGWVQLRGSSRLIELNLGYYSFDLTNPAGVLIPDVHGLLAGVYAPYTGYIRMVDAALSTPLTNGTLTFKPWINNVEAIDTSLDVVLSSGANPQFNSTLEPLDVIDFEVSPGDLLYLKGYGDALNTPAVANVKCTIFVELSL